MNQQQKQQQSQAQQAHNLSEIFNTNDWYSLSHDRINITRNTQDGTYNYYSHSYYPSHYYNKEKDEYPGFTIENILTSTECSQLIDFSNRIGYQNLDRIFPQTYRQSSRILLFSQKVARILYDRICLFLQPNDINNIIPIGFGRSGKWIPVRLNECLKIIKYHQDGMIIPHQDGPWVPFEDQASIYTIVFYLNENYQGGETVILPHSEIGCREIRFAARTFGEEIEPKTGKIAVFDHRCVHAGKPVVSGVKYILRAEMIFQRVYSPTAGIVDRNAYMYTVEYQEARRLYDLSQRAEWKGQKEEFVSTYQEVLKLQCAASADENRRARLQHLPLSDGDALCWSLIVHWLSIQDVLTLSTVSKGLSLLLQSNEIWHAMYVSRWGDALLPNSNSGVVRDTANRMTLDWRSLYQLRFHFVKSFRSTILYLGLDCIKYGTLDQSKTWWRDRNWGGRSDDFHEMQFPLGPDPLTDVYHVGQIPSRFYDIMRSEIMTYSYPYHMNLPDYVRFIPLVNRRSTVAPNTVPYSTIKSDMEIYSEIKQGTFPDQGRSLVLDSGEPVNWSVCAALIRLVIGLQSTHPILFIVNPTEFPVVYFNSCAVENSNDIQTSLQIIRHRYKELILSLSNVLCTPAVRVEHIAVPALAYFKMNSGFAIWVSHEHVYATSVRLGIVRENLLIRGPGKTGSQNSVTIGRECCNEALNWRLDGNWDTFLNDSSPQYIDTSIPIVLIQAQENIESNEIFLGIFTYLTSPEFTQQMGSFRHTEEEIIEGLPPYHRPNKFQYMGVVDSLALLKGAYELSIHPEHRSKCFFNSFA